MPLCRRTWPPRNPLRSQLGIGGSFNTSGNDGTITRFGWKAQNKSLLMFAGEAYNVEMGVSNELFPNERGAVPGCVFNPTPDDAQQHSERQSNSPIYSTTLGTVSEMSSDIVNFAAFIRLSAPAAPAPPTASTINGSTLFNSIGCALCHSPSLTTAASIYTGMGGVTYQPYSDFALHHMGPGSGGRNQPRRGRSRTSSAPPRSGASANASFSCMTDAPPTCCRPSRPMAIRGTAGINSIAALGRSNHSRIAAPKPMP